MRGWGLGAGTGIVLSLVHSPSIAASFTFALDRILRSREVTWRVRVPEYHFPVCMKGAKYPDRGRLPRNFHSRVSMMRPLERGKFRVSNRPGSALGGVSNLIVKFECRFWRSTESMDKKSPLESGHFFA